MGNVELQEPFSQVRDTKSADSAGGGGPPAPAALLP